MPGESSLSPATSSSAGVATPRQLQRQQSRKTRPVFAEDTTSLPVPSSGAAAALPPRGRAGDRHPVSPREHGRAQGPTAHPRHALPGDTAHPEQPEHRCSCKNINNKKFTPELPENFKTPSTHGTSRPE